MKDMLASLPQYQEQREKVRRVMCYPPQYTQFERLVFAALEYGTRVHGHFRAR
jgi:hypothetical protein